MKRICSSPRFGVPCVQSSRGAFWNFPGSGPEHWHRDGDLPLSPDALEGQNDSVYKGGGPQISVSLVQLLKVGLILFGGFLVFWTKPLLKKTSLVTSKLGRYCTWITQEMFWNTFALGLGALPKIEHGWTPSFLQFTETTSVNSPKSWMTS